MTNKALAKQQKMTLRAKPLPKVAKPKNPYAMAVKQRLAGTHRVTVSGQRQEQKRSLNQVLGDPAGQEN